MCLSIEVQYPSRILEKGHYQGIEWIISHNGMGTRCGYAKVDSSHPFYGCDMSHLPCIDVHGGITFAENDIACGKGNDDGYWLGFDCGRSCDATDLELPCESGFMMPNFFGGNVRSQDYVRDECIKLCKEILNAKIICE